MNEELIQKLIESNQTAIRTLGSQIENIKKKVERDQADQWKIISEIIERLKEIEKCRKKHKQKKDS